MYLALSANPLNIPYLYSDCVNLNMCKANNVHYGWYTLSLSMSVPLWKRDAENSPCKVVVVEFIKYRRFTSHYYIVRHRNINV